MAYKHRLLPLFPGKADFRLFLTLKAKLSVAPGLLSPAFPRVFRLPECRVAADEPLSTGTFPTAFVFTWFKENN